MSLLPPVPRAQALVTAAGRLMTALWADWILDLADRVDRTAQRIGSTVALTAQAAAIGATAIPTPVLSRGLYRLMWTARITQAATTSSSLTITLAWTDGGVACSLSGAALTANTTATVQSGEILVQADENTTLQYSTAYASVGATPMQYAVTVRAERVP